MSLRQPGATTEAINHSSKGRLTTMNRNDKTTLTRLQNGRPSFFCAGMVPVTAKAMLTSLLRLPIFNTTECHSRVPVESLGR